MLTPIVLTKLKRSEIAPLSARAVADARITSELGLGTPAGDSGTADLGSAGAAAQVASPLHTLRDHLLKIARGSRS